MRVASAVLVLSLAVASTAQQDIAWLGDGNPTTGVVNAFPFGASGVRTQQLVPGSLFGGNPALIQDLFVAPGQEGTVSWLTSEVVYADIEIRMGSTSLQALTSDWVTNLPNPVVVHRGPLRVRFERDRWTPLGLTSSFVWLPAGPGENLVVDVTVWGVADPGNPLAWNGLLFMWLHTGSPPSLQRAYERNFTATRPSTATGVDLQGIELGFLLADGNFVAHGGGCSGSSGHAPEIGTPAGTWPQIGGQVTFELTNGRAHSTAALVIGGDTSSLGGIPLPYDLGTFGAPGCRMWHDIVAVSPGIAVDAAGFATLALPIPTAAGLITLRLYGSWLCADPGANAANLTTSGYATIILGT